MEHWYNKYAVLTMSAATCLGGYNWIDWGKLSASDWGTWFGAVGSIGALAGTIWIATTGERRRYREERARAIVAVVDIRIKMNRVTYGIQFVIEALDDDFGSGFGHDYLALARVLTESGMWSNEEILPLIMLRKGVVANLVGVRSSVEHVLPMLEKAAKDAQLAGVRMPAYDEAILPYLRGARASMSVAHSECQAFMLVPPHRRY
jgi:hypothetical protein